MSNEKVTQNDTDVNKTENSKTNIKVNFDEFPTPVREEFKQFQEIQKKNDLLLKNLSKSEILNIKIEDTNHNKSSDKITQTQFDEKEQTQQNKSEKIIQVDTINDHEEKKPSTELTKPSPHIAKMIEENQMILNAGKNVSKADVKDYERKKNLPERDPETQKFKYLKRGARWGEIENKISKPSLKSTPKQTAQKNLVEQLKDVYSDLPTNSENVIETSKPRELIHAWEDMRLPARNQSLLNNTSKITSNIIDTTQKPNSYVEMYKYRKDPSSMSNSSINSPNTSKSSKKKLLVKKLESELESEIKFYKEENKRLRQMSQELLREKKALAQEKEDFLKRKYEEQEKFEKYKETERKRITQLKRVHERRVRANSKFTKRMVDNKEKNKLEAKIQKLTLQHKANEARFQKLIEDLQNENNNLRIRIKQLESQLKPSTDDKPSTDTTTTQKTSSARRKLFSSPPKTLPTMNAYLDDSDSDDECTARTIQESMKKLEKSIATTLSKKILDDSDDEILKYVNDDPLEDVNMNIPNKNFIQSNGHSRYQNENVLETETIDDDIRPSQTHTPLSFFLNELHEKYKVDDSETEPKETGILKEQNYLGGGKIERIYTDRQEIQYANGTVKKIFDNGFTIVNFTNGDVKKIFPSGKVTYFYDSAQTLHTTYPNQLQVYQFANGQVEKHYPDGNKEIIFPDRTLKVIKNNGEEDIKFPDGTHQFVTPEKHKIVQFADGHRETLLNDGTKRIEYPNGSVKIQYRDGREVTRYPDSRIRERNILKDTS